MWNNLSVLHRRHPFDPNSRRVIHRTQIRGNERIRVKLGLRGLDAATATGSGAIGT
jgi:Taurine catabolism dioxygenase TauD, TfdA family